MNLPRLTLKLTPRGCEIEAPDHGVTIVIGPRKCGPRLPETAVSVIDVPGFDLAEGASVQPNNVRPFRRAL